MKRIVWVDQTIRLWVPVFIIFLGAFFIYLFPPNRAILSKKNCLLYVFGQVECILLETISFNPAVKKTKLIFAHK